MDEAEIQPIAGLAKKSPVRYTPSLGDEICRRIATGEGLNTICKTDNMPDESTVREWALFETAKTQGFSPKYAQARELGAMARVERIGELATMEPRMIKTITRSRDGKADIEEERIDPAFEQWRKTQIDTEKWIASKVLPKIYGDRIVLDHRLSVDPKTMSDAELAAIAFSGRTIEGKAADVSAGDEALGIAAE